MAEMVEDPSEALRLLKEKFGIEITTHLDGNWGIVYVQMHLGGTDNPPTMLYDLDGRDTMNFNIDVNGMTNEHFSGLCGIPIPIADTFSMTERVGIWLAIGALSRGMRLVTLSTLEKYGHNGASAYAIDVPSFSSLSELKMKCELKNGA